MFLPKTIIFNNNLTFQLIDRRKAPVDGRSPAAVDRFAVDHFAVDLCGFPLGGLIEVFGIDNIYPW